jgi:RimJ/RimL family protein N-acetyltransferase
VRETQPTLRTPRLVMRPFLQDDAPSVQQLAGERRVAETTLNIPHPYPEGGAEAWIASHPRRFAAGDDAVFAIRVADGLVGAIGLNLALYHRRAELGYWIGLPFWNRGYATEAGTALLWYGFEGLDLNRIQATHFAGNPASGRVMQKLGMHYEGRSPQYVLRWDTFQDVDRYAILRQDYQGPPWQVEVL